MCPVTLNKHCFSADISHFKSIFFFTVRFNQITTIPLNFENCRENIEIVRNPRWGILPGESLTRCHTTGKSPSGGWASGVSSFLTACSSVTGAWLTVLQQIPFLLSPYFTSLSPLSFPHCLLVSLKS